MLALLLTGVAHAQVGQSATPLLGSPLLEGVKPNAAGLITLKDGSSVVLRQREGFLLSALVVVPNGQPSGLSVTGGTANASGSAGGSSAGTGVKRAAELIGLLSGFGDGLTGPLSDFLNRSDVVPRLSSGVNVTAQPFTIRAQTSGKMLSLDIRLAQVDTGKFAASPLVIAPRKPSAKPVVLRIYSDFQCPYCKQFETQAWPTLMKGLPDDVRVEFHHLPLEPIHPLARPAAEAAECAAQQGKFWAFKDALFADSAWLQGNPNKGFIALADKLGLKMDTFKTCLAERGGFDAVNAGLQEAAALGLNSTPTILVNGYRPGNPYDAQAILNLIRFARVADSVPATPTKP